MTSTLHLALAGSLAAGAALLAAAPASAAPYCPAHESFFGTVQRVYGDRLTVRTSSGHWATVRIDSGARINTNGNTLRPGAYVGAYGCVTPNGVFHASELTLASNARGYSEHLAGVVQRVEGNRLIVRESNGQYGTWYVPDSEDFRAGQRVSGVGMLAGGGAFYPQSVDGRGVAYDADSVTGPQGPTVTLTGTVQRVRSGDSIVVWEPGRHTSGTWIVGDASRFRAGERVTASGTQDRSGRFYVQRITIL